ncbi:hypothetical protein NDN08_008124 [Rhodosorus marinus]|uniref:Acetyl-CoA acetyltransferase n=1 Tax=Rhodosorus marinus TaxID=101924 RepID=A0AAV8V334_9RHOD|nr:hypothetical protein NDN08_008124 [Rhodosorus marinus]
MSVLSRCVPRRGLCAASGKKTPLPQPVYIVGSARTPMGSYGGALKNLSATDLGSIAVKEAISRSRVRATSIEELIMGNVLSAGLGQAPARTVCLSSGLAETTTCTTVNKVCSSGLKAITMAAQSVGLGLVDLAVAGGMESMSRVPYYNVHMRFDKRETFVRGDLEDGMIRDGLWDSKLDVHMGSIADKLARDSGISREDLDGVAASSYSKAARALSNQSFKEVVPIDGVLDVDEEIARVSLVEKLPNLKPAFAEDGLITAGNSSTISDGAAAVVLASERAVESQDLKPLAKIVSYADAEVHPQQFPIAPTKAIPLALERADMQLSDVGLFEINEAFASVIVDSVRKLNLNAARVNVYGGAIAMGHPIGASGARILTTLISGLHGTNTSSVGVAAICNGGGGSTAVVMTKDV